MYKLIPTNQFKKDLKKIKKQSGINFNLIFDFLKKLENSVAVGIKKNIDLIN